MVREIDEMRYGANRNHRHAQDAHTLSKERTRYKLSPREMTVLEEMANGLSDRQIAEKLCITRFTVNKHVTAIMCKMQALSRTAAAVRAIKENLVR